jgi:import inner membrane translocase subunit TIM8
MSASAKLSPADQKRLEDMVNQVQVQSAVIRITDRCWDKCVTSKIGSSFDATEKQCLSYCGVRFLDASIFLQKVLSEKQA